MEETTANSLAQAQLPGGGMAWFWTGSPKEIRALESVAISRVWVLRSLWDCKSHSSLKKTVPEDSRPVSASDRWPFGPQESSLQNDVNKTHSWLPQQLFSSKRE